MSLFLFIYLLCSLQLFLFKTIYIYIYVYCLCTPLHYVFDSPNCTFKLKLRPHWYPLELMESNRRVHISYRVSGETLGPDFVWKKPEHEWQTFVRALHYLAARKCDVPVWNVELLWGFYDPWDETQLPMNVHIECQINPVRIEITDDDADDDHRCCNCWEDCEGIDKRFAHVLNEYWKGGRDPQEFLNCETCAPSHLCDLCHVDLPGGGSSCLECFAPYPEIRETDGDYFGRVVSMVWRGLTDSQMNRWQCVRHRA